MANWSNYRIVDYERLDLTETLEAVIKITVMIYQNLRNNLPPETQKKADELMRQLKQAVAEGNTAKIDEIENNLTALLFDAPKSKSEAAFDNVHFKATVMLYQNRRNHLQPETQKKADELMRQLKQAVAEGNTSKIDEIENNLTALLFEY